MAAEAIYSHDRHLMRTTAVAAASSGEIWQLPDGRAAVLKAQVAPAAGDETEWATDGVYTVTKTANFVWVDGSEIYWDHSANSAVLFPADDRDFYIGVAVGDATSAATTGRVNLNVRPTWAVDLFRDGYQSVLAGTPAASAFGYPVPCGGGAIFELTATNEAQKVDALAVNGFDAGSNWILEGSFRVLSDGASGVQDFSIGAASGTHATDFQSVTSLCTLHLDGNDTKIYAESDDNATDVAPTDTTKVYVEGTDRASRVYFVMDARAPGDVQYYINGVNVLPNSTFTAGLTGTLFPVVHLEKTATADVYKIAVDSLRVRLCQQDNPMK